MNTRQEINTTREGNMDDYRGRVNLALSIISHRKPTPESFDLIRRILLGATMDELVEIDCWRVEN